MAVHIVGVAVILQDGMFFVVRRSLLITKNNVDANYHAHQETWEQLKEYCHSHPENLYRSEKFVRAR